MRESTLEAKLTVKRKRRRREREGENFIFVKNLVYFVITVFISIFICQ